MNRRRLTRDTPEQHEVLPPAKGSVWSRLLAPVGGRICELTVGCQPLVGTRHRRRRPDDDA